MFLIWAASSWVAASSCPPAVTPTKPTGRASVFDVPLFVLEPVLVLEPESLEPPHPARPSTSAMTTAHRRTGAEGSRRAAPPRLALRPRRGASCPPRLLRRALALRATGAALRRPPSFCPRRGVPRRRGSFAPPALVLSRRGAPRD